MSDKVVNSGRVSFSNLLLILFITLKICGVITWSWWWVLSPFWIPILLYIIVYGIFNCMK